MTYARTTYGPGNIAALQSGVGLTWGPTIGSNDPTSPQSTGGSRGAYSIPPLSGLGRVTGHAPVPMSGCGCGCGSGRPGMGTNGNIRVMQIVPGALEAAMAARRLKLEVPLQPTSAQTNLIDNEPAVDETPTDETFVEEPTVPSWVWVVGGLGAMGLIGGLIWYAMK